MRVLSCADPAGREGAVATAAASVRAGGLVVFPTESAYVFGTDAFSPPATDELRRLRGVGPQVPLQVLVRNAGVIDGVASPASAQARDLATAFWPGGLTLIVPASPSLQWRLGGDERFVQLRSPLHPLALELISEVGPTVTSVARPGDRPLITGPDDAAGLDRQITFFLEHGTIDPAPRSTIVDCTGDRVTILRTGAIAAGELAGVLGYRPDEA